MPQPPKQRHGLARVLSKLGYCSRSEATVLVKAGRVTLNGQVKRDPDAPARAGVDTVAVDGKPVKAVRQVYVMLNKPRGLVTTVSDELGRDTIYECLKSTELPPHLPAVGRLDKASEGLLLMSNDTQWASAITDPVHHVDKVYHVQINRLANASFIQEMLDGVAADDGSHLSAKKVTLLRSGEVNSWLEVTLDEGKNRHIRRLIEGLGVEVIRLMRVSIGPLQLGTLAKGAWRFLTPSEIAAVVGKRAR